MTVLCAPAGTLPDDGMLARLPAAVRVVRAWGAASAASLDEERSVGLVDDTGAISLPLQTRVATWRRQHVPPDLLPLGRREIPRALHGLRAAAQLIEEDRPDVILASIDPEATMVVASRLGERFGIPFVLDFRDPWATCDLRRASRWPVQRRLVDAIERFAIERAAAVVWNTESARDAAAGHYGPALARKFEVVRNHHDSGLVGPLTAQPTQATGPFRVLFLGRLRKFVAGEVLFRALRLLRAEGVTPAQLLVDVTGTVPAESVGFAESMGVRDFVALRPGLPHAAIGAAMEQADLLLALSHASMQRIPSKMYDYLASDRRVVVLSDNRELAEIIAPFDGVEQHGQDDAEGLASSLRAAMLRRGERFSRDVSCFDSRVATSRLSAILKRVTSDG